MADLSKLPTPEHCIADFCLIPIGTSHPSVAQEVADVQRLVQQSGLTHTMHSAGTTIEGPWDKVLTLIGQAHTYLHQQGRVRVHTDIRVGSRTDKKETMEGKISAVQKILGK
ncbi:hypothetical protein VTO42DRAFT_420 [Malbranchea cinnamomea]